MAIGQRKIQRSSTRFQTSFSGAKCERPFVAGVRFENIGNGIIKGNFQTKFDYPGFHSTVFTYLKMAMIQDEFSNLAATNIIKCQTMRKVRRNERFTHHNYFAELSLAASVNPDCPMFHKGVTSR